MRVQRAVSILATLLIAATGALAIFSIYQVSRGRDDGSSAVSQSAITIGGPFSLVNDEGEPVTEKDFLGRAHLVFFGFTHCPDVCPTTLSEATAVLDVLGDDAARLDVLFVSVDPGRDTPEVLKEYVGYFHPQIMGLTGTEQQVASMAKEFRAFYKKVPLEGDDYTMDHSTVVYLFDKKGAFVGPVALDRDPAEVARDLRKYL